MEVFTERGATLYATSPRKKGMSKPSFMAPPEPLDKLLTKKILSNDSDSDSDSERPPPVASSVSELTKLPSPFHVPEPTSPESDPSLLSITDEEKQILLSEASFSLDNRPFLSALFAALDYKDNDYFQLFSLCLIYAMQVNTGINKELLESIQIPSKNSQELHFYNKVLVEKMIKLASAGCQYDSRVRLVTLEILITSLKLVVIRDDKSNLMDEHFAEVEGAREESTLILRNFYKSEEIFLDMFEDEFREMTKKPINFEFIMSDASLLLPPTGTPLTGIDFRKRLPCGEVEKARKAIRTFFLLRNLSLSLQGLKETCLPLSNPDSFVQAGDVLDLNNSDLLAVTVVFKDGMKQRRFLVVDLMQIILIEPDGHRLGWGVAKFSGFLQDLEVNSDKDDSRCLYVTVHKPSSGNAKGTPTPLLSAAFTFDDHIRCMAAKQRLTKGRTKARQRKMHLIAKLLELPTTVGTACPSPPHHTLSSLRQGAQARRARMVSSSSPRHSVDSGVATGAFRPLFTANLRVPGTAAMVRSREGGRARDRSSSRESSPVLESDGIRMEPIPRSQELRGQQGDALEAQEETSFEGGTTWYVGEGADESQTEGSTCATDSPRRGAVHDV